VQYGASLRCDVAGEIGMICRWALRELSPGYQPRMPMASGGGLLMAALLQRAGPGRWRVVRFAPRDDDRWRCMGMSGRSFTSAKLALA
jgi:hypothetical protein